MTIPEHIERDFREGWTGSADSWWAQHSYVKTINSIAPTFTRLKQEALIIRLGYALTRSGGRAAVWGWNS